MATKEELFAAVRTLKTHCRETECNACVLKPLCHNGDIDTIGDSSPYFWPDPEEGDGEDGQCIELFAHPVGGEQNRITPSSIA